MSAASPADELSPTPASAARRTTAPLLLGLVTLIAPRLPGGLAAAALYPALGVFPGMALATWLGGRRDSARWTLGLALSPLVATLVAAPLVRAGIGVGAAALGIALGGWLLWAAGSWTARPEHRTETSDRRFLLAFGGGVGLAFAIPWIVSPFMRVRSDAWIHAGLVWDIVRHGLPPEDPRFAGLTLNYVWFYNLFVALLVELGARDPFVVMSLVNTVNVAVFVSLAWHAARRLWSDRTAARGAALLAVLGLNAGTWMLWPLRLLRAVWGETRGWDLALDELHHVHLGSWRVLYSLAAPFAWMVSFVDKFTVGTALNYAWVLLLLWLWAALDWVERGARETLVWAALAAAGMLFFHGVVGLSAVPVALAALGVLWLARGRLTWLPSRGRLVALAAATLAGAAIAGPYTREISAGWAAAKSGVKTPWFQPSPLMLWTVLTSCGVAAAFAWRPLLRIVRERRAGGALIATFALGMTAFALVVNLPQDNESKFAFQVFFALALIGGAAFLPAFGTLARRRGRAIAAVTFAALFLVAPVVVLGSYLVDPEAKTAPELHPRPGEESLYAWIAARTEPDAVVVDSRGRDLVMVKARRRLWVGTPSGPEKAGFPADEMAERRAVEADLHAARPDVARDARSLARLGRPVYVLYRPDEDPGEPWRALASRPDLFRLAFEANGFRLYRLEAASRP